jgi:hypothetical protein
LGTSGRDSLAFAQREQIEILMQRERIAVLRQTAGGAIQRVQLHLFGVDFVLGVELGDIDIFDKHIGKGEACGHEEYRNAAEAAKSCHPARWWRGTGFFINHRDLLSEPR